MKLVRINFEKNGIFLFYFHNLIYVLKSSVNAFYDDQKPFLNM